MSVVSFEFLGFLAALAVVYYVLPMRVRKWALLAGSAAVLAALRLAGGSVPHGGNAADLGLRTPDGAVFGA